MSALQPGGDCPSASPLRGLITLVSLNVHTHNLQADLINLICCHRSRSLILSPPEDQAAAPLTRDQLNHHPWEDGVPAWIMNRSAAPSEAEVLEEQMLKAGILASLQDAPDNPDSKVEVPKSSVSSLRLVIISYLHV